MESFSTPLLDRIKEFVGGFIGEHFSEKICYHNIDHTIDVVAACEEIALASEVSEKKLEIILIAAWFHDTGYYLGCCDHEKESAAIAQQYLLKEGLPEEAIEQVMSCILSTKLPQKPSNLLECIICDADLYHLSTDQFFEKSKLLLHEISFTSNPMPLDEWIDESIHFIAGHRYHTEFCQKNRMPFVKKNLQLLHEKRDARMVN